MAWAAMPGQQPRLVSDGLRQINPRSQALVLAVGSTGRMQADGRLALTGGGDIELRVGGALNPALPTPYESSGSVTNLRGQTSLQAASFGRLDPLYGVKAARDTRALDLFRAADVVTTGGIALYAGDSAFRLRSLGDLAIEKADDPGRAPMPLSMPYVRPMARRARTAPIPGSRCGPRTPPSTCSRPAAT